HKGQRFSAGTKHTEQSKQNMSFGHTGIRRNKEQRKKHRVKYNKNWRRVHPEKILEYDKKALKPRAIANAERRRRLRKEAIVKLGGRCSSTLCRWVNEDGTTGCTDFRILQFDHVLGGGTKTRKSLYF